MEKINRQALINQISGDTQTDRMIKGADDKHLVIHFLRYNHVIGRLEKGY